MWERNSSLHKERRQKRQRRRERYDSLPNLSVSRQYFNLNLNMAGYSPVNVQNSNSASSTARAHSLSSHSIPGNLPRVGSGHTFSPANIYHSPHFQRFGILIVQYVNRGIETFRGMKVWHMFLMALLCFFILDQIGFLASGSRSLSLPVDPVAASLKNENSQTVHIYHFRDNKNENATINYKARLTALGKETKQLVDAETNSMKKHVQGIDDNLGNLLDRLNSMVNLVTSLKSDLTEAKSEINSLKTAVDGIYDSSNVGATVLQNLESYSEKSKHPWVFPCDWNSCRVQNLSQVLNYLGASRAVGRKIKVVQLGGCSIDAALSFIDVMGKDITEFILVDEWAPGSSAAEPRCRGQNKTNGTEQIVGKEKAAHVWRGEIEMDSEFKSVNTWAKSVNDTEVKILRKEYLSSEVLNQFQSKSIDVLFIDHCLESQQKTLLNILKNWIGKLDTGGIIIGHSYGVAKPSLVDFNGIATHWNKGFTGFVDKNELLATKRAVDEFVMDKKDNTVTGIHVAGDTVFYLQKRKVRLSDLFNDP
mmetsp:Transcript_9894/g.12832  ORF Transcript_9894/g.12832 Transcript_9894/m.12832 type:complete len:534 (+) Transcript_9894:167-1768(+)